MKSFLLVSMIVLVQVFAAHAMADDLEFKETGRFGIMGSVTDDLVKVGPVFYSESWEASLFLHYDNDSQMNSQLDTMLKVGWRANLGHSNYLSVGLEYSPEFAQKIQNTNVSGTYKAGPYIGFQRYFAGNNLLINFWVNPYYYEESKQIDGSVLIDRHVLQNGGFGVGYMF